jgi:hypothetical protein
MDDYIKNFESYTKIVVYDFKLGNGGIGDYCKFFMYVLCLCIKHKFRVYYVLNDIPIETYMRLKYNQMYINRYEIPQANRIKTESEMFDTDCIIVTSDIFYNTYTYDAITLRISDVFEFSNTIILNSQRLFSRRPSDYIALHLRLGDKYLETDMSYVVCKEDERTFDADKLLLFIEENHQRNIVFFCDNNQFKQIIKFKYDQIIITDCNIGHTSLYNTTDDQILDTISEFYIMCNSSHIYSATPYFSGFAAMAAKFKNIPISDI